MKNPNYKKIYEDLINSQFPYKMSEFKDLFKKEQFSVLDVIELDKKLLGNEGLKDEINQKLRAYDRFAILKILDYQKRNKLNNSQLANHFKLSRNTVTAWKKIFL